MNNFELYNPTYFAFGRGTQKKTGELVRRFGGTKALLHYGGGSVVRSGLLAEVEKSLDEAGVAYVTLGGVKPNPRSGLVYEGIELCRREGVDFVVGVGGGSAIDSGKAIAAGASAVMIGSLFAGVDEEGAAKRGHRLEDMSLEEMEEIYQEARHELEGKEPVPVEHRE